MIRSRELRTCCLLVVLVLASASTSALAAPARQPRDRGRRVDPLALSAPQVASARQVLQSRPAWLRLSDPDHLAAAVLTVAESSLSTVEKEVLSQRLRSLARRSGAIKIAPGAANYSRDDRYRPLIQLPSLESIGQSVALHELDHFAAYDKVLGRIMKRAGGTWEAAYRRLEQRKVNDPRFAGTLVQWLEERGIAAETKNGAPRESSRHLRAYPSLERARRLAGSSAARDDRLLDRLARQLAATTDHLPQRSASTHERLSAVESNRQLRTFDFPTSYWQSPEERSLLGTLRARFDGKLADWRQRRYRAAALRALPTEAEFLTALGRETRSARGGAYHFSDEEGHVDSGDELICHLGRYPQLARLAANADALSVDRFLAAVRQRVTQGLRSEDASVDAVLPKLLARGICRCPDLATHGSVGSGGLIDQLLVARFTRQAARHDSDAATATVPTPALRTLLKRNKPFRERIQSGAIELRNLDTITAVLDNGVDLQKPFWGHFEWLLRTADPRRLMQLARRVEPSEWRRRSIERLEADLRGRGQKDKVWVFEGWKRRADKDATLESILTAVAQRAQISP